MKSQWEQKRNDNNNNNNNQANNKGHKRDWKTNRDNSLGNSRQMIALAFTEA